MMEYTRIYIIGLVRETSPRKNTVPEYSPLHPKYEDGLYITLLHDICQPFIVGHLLL